MIVIDQYSVSTVPIEMYFDQTKLSLGTAFIWESGGNYFLITNWHNLSGRDTFSGKHLSPTAAEPNNIKVWFNAKGKLGQRVAGQLAIRDTNHRPFWLCHPQHGAKIDVVALPVAPPAEADMYPINLMSNDNLEIQVGMDVFVLGYPYGIGVAALPVWKRASIASEPKLLLDQPFFLIDTAGRPGMSGSPVIRRSWGTHMIEHGSISMGPGSATKFVGIYSGRIASADPLDAQLGLTWPANLVEEIVTGGRRDS